MSTSGKQPSLNRVALRRRISVRINNSPRAAQTRSARKVAPARLAGSAMLSPEAWNEIARSLKLSVRELQIVRGMFDHQKERNIAIGLGLSAHTIHSHVQRLHYKLGITARPQLLQRVMQEFLVLTASPGNRLPPICGNRARGRCPFGL